MNNVFKIKKGLKVNGSGSVVVDVLGNVGQLFSVTDNLTGSLFSVNDISGIPVMEAFSNDTVRIGTYGFEGIVVSGSNINLRALPTTGSVTHIPVFTTDPATTSSQVVSRTPSEIALDILSSIPGWSTGSNQRLENNTGSLNWVNI